jgi:hypothetical protein
MGAFWDPTRSKSSERGDDSTKKACGGNRMAYYGVIFYEWTAISREFVMSRKLTQIDKNQSPF